MDKSFREARFKYSLLIEPIKRLKLLPLEGPDINSALLILFTFILHPDLT